MSPQFKNFFFIITSTVYVADLVRPEFANTPIDGDKLPQAAGVQQ
jgi:hypothetical protein